MDESGPSLDPPGFDPGAALAQLQRQLRDLKLTARGNGFELRGKRVAKLQVDGDTLAARTARKLAATPEWDRQLIGNASQQRQWLLDLKQRLERWDREE